MADKQNTTEIDCTVHTSQILSNGIKMDTWLGSCSSQSIQHSDAEVNMSMQFKGLSHKPYNH